MTIILENYPAYTRDLLKSELKRRNLPTTGLKKELIARLEEDDDAAVTTPTKSASASSSATRRTRPETNGQTAASTNGRTPEDKRNGHAPVMSPAAERAGLVLWRRPFTVVYYFVLESAVLLQELLTSLTLYLRTVLLCLCLLGVLTAAYLIDGPHQQYVTLARSQLIWCLYWVGLGVLSSVGLGTGLHTFLLYLGPHIASVTLAAFECQSVDFPSPPYPDRIVCPSGNVATAAGGMTLWAIISKVRLESFMWGLGTAIGELPPYFMARAARLSGEMTEDEKELEDLVEEAHKHPQDLGFFDRMKVKVHDLVQRVGFIGILACASIPNPLFDLAGITCGHFLIPFWTFFGATLIGKAVIKMHIQMLTVVFVFSEKHVEQVLNIIKGLPRYGSMLHAPFQNWLRDQKTKLHHKPGEGVPESQSVLSWVFEKLVLVMVVYFVVSIVNSMAQSYHKRRSQRTGPRPAGAFKPARE